MDEKDLALLRSVSGAGNMLKPCELADDPDLGMDLEEVSERLARLLAQGYVKCYFLATIEGSSQVVRRVHHHRALKAA